MNRRRQPFQGWLLPELSVDSAELSSKHLPDFALFIGAKLQKSEPAEICLDFDKPRFSPIVRSGKLSLFSITWTIFRHRSRRNSIGPRAAVREQVLAVSPRSKVTIGETLHRMAHLMKQGASFMFIRVLLGVSIVGLAILGVFLVGHKANAASKTPIPAAKVDQPLASTPGKESAVFAGGCFWGTQAVFERVKGVIHTTAGYTGGSATTATYDQVTTETTGHAESVEVVYDPSKITYGQLLRIFFSVAHDPTQLNRQGPDVGSSYRSVIFYLGDDQKRIANAYISQLDDAKVFPGRIVTQVTPLKGFYRAEDYHQDYALHNPENPYIQVCDRPKIEALKQQFPDLFVDYEGRH